MLAIDEITQIRNALKNTYFAAKGAGYLDTKSGQNDLDEHVFGRYEICLKHVVPWVAHETNLSKARMVEIGCGTGSSTAAFAKFAEHVYGFDIDGPAIEAARQRCMVMGLNNVQLEIVKAEMLIETIRSQCKVGIDIVLMYAVLEHMTVHERIESIRACWNMLSPGGLLVVYDTPNRLLFEDHHTSFLPFFHMLPVELAIEYASRSPREDFRAAMQKKGSESDDELYLRLERWGRGVSYHEFEVALQRPVSDLVVSDGFALELRELLPILPAEDLLRAFIESSGIAIDLAFTRPCINVILRKSESTVELRKVSQAPPCLWVSRAEMEKEVARVKALVEAQTEPKAQELVVLLLEKLKRRIRHTATKRFGVVGEAIVDTIMKRLG